MLARMSYVFSKDNKELGSTTVEAVSMSSQTVDCTSLSSHDGTPPTDWPHLQHEDPVISRVPGTLIQNQSLNKLKPDTPAELTWMLRERDRLAIQDGILYRRRMVEDSEKLVLPTDDAKSGSS